MTNKIFKAFNLTIVVLLTITILAGCDDSAKESQAMPPIAIHQGDECHVCGMIITNYPGPKGELYIRGNKHPYKYCSTRDLFSHYLQPEVKIAATQIYVHDMAVTNWDKPGNDAFTNARTAWYVIDQPMKGAMGPTLASFAKKSDAQEFVRQHGGRIISFDEITLKILANLGQGEKDKHNMQNMK
jgi:copper chaperone NosL